MHFHWSDRLQAAFHREDPPASFEAWLRLYRYGGSTPETSQASFSAKPNAGGRERSRRPFHGWKVGADRGVMHAMPGAVLLRDRRQKLCFGQSSFCRNRLDGDPMIGARENTFGGSDRHSSAFECRLQP